MEENTIFNIQLYNCSMATSLYTNCIKWSWLDLQLPMQSLAITTKVVKPVHGEVYSIQHYVIKFVSDLWHVGGFFHL
jgi:hypothetical protein